MSLKRGILWTAGVLVATSLLGSRQSTVSFKESSKETPVKVGCIGNSITYGFLVENREENNYPTRLQSILGDGYDVRNFGKSGATLLKKGHRPYMEQEEYAAAIEFAPDIIIVHLGVNDTDPRNFPDYGDEFVGDYVALIDSFKKVNPDVRVILANLTPLLSKHYRYRSGTRAWRDSIRSYIPVVAEITGSELIDWGDLLKDHPQLLPDGIHPNVEGALMLAESAASAITGNYGGLKLPHIYGDGMVLQRYRPLNIGGTANAGDRVTVSLNGVTRKAITGNDGKWAVTLPPMREGSGYTMTIKAGNDSVTFNDVAIGEVWLASGQSNMEFQMRYTTTFQDELSNANDPLLRLYNMFPVAYTNGKEWGDEEKEATNKLQHYQETGWTESTEKTMAEFSAIAWYFGKMLRDSLNVPVGIINNSIGGSPTEAWIDIETLEHEIPEILVNWRSNDYLQPWVQQRIGENAGKGEDSKNNRHPYEPSYLFASGIRPLGQYPIAGTIWYQGESNAHNVEIHEALFPALVDSWRNYWNQPDMPFLFVQLSSLNRPSWPAFRNSQRLLSRRIPGTAMAVSSDVGDSLDVHPRNKKPVGERLGRQALHRVYSMTNVMNEGPGIQEACVIGPHTVVLTFENAEGLSTADGSVPKTFEVAEFEGMFVPVDSAIITENNQIILYSMSIENPRYVRYGWQPFTRANVVNGAKLPASTFRIEVTQDKNTEEGIEAGVSAIYLGKINDEIVMAGGCNFPSNPMAPGSQKKFYQGIYRIVKDDDTNGWNVEKIGDLPQPMAYGNAITTPKGLFLIGGTTATSALKTVYCLKADDSGKLVITEVLSLPVKLDNAAAAYYGGKIYIAGGSVDGQPSNRFFSLDIENPKELVELPPFPGNPRVQPVMGASKDGKGNEGIYMWGGFAGKGKGREASLDTDGFKYDLKKKQWTKLAAPTTPDGEEISTGGGAATTLADGRIVIVGGVNKDIFLEALRNQAPDYLSHPIDWYKFNQRLLIYNPITSTWDVSEPNQDLARAGAGIVTDGNGVLVVGGEIKPRIRTSDIVFVEID